MTAASTALLRVEDLHVRIPTGDGTVEPVRGVSFEVGRGETLGIVGESGSGKSVTSLAVLRIMDPPALVAARRLELDGVDLLALPEERMSQVRGRRAAMVFQDALAALNPVLSVGHHLTETLRTHLRLSRREARARALELLRMVEMPEPERRLGQYPHELSGGMRQRLMIAMALACGPALLIADEPTSALDTTIQAQILDLLARLRTEMGMSVILISHDLGVVAGTADRLLVMYAGHVVEEGPVDRVFANPRMPYTQGLLRSAPRADMGRRLRPIPGVPPALGAEPGGCPFAPRCELAEERCRHELPELRRVGPGHRAACLLDTGPDDDE